MKVGMSLQLAQYTWEHRRKVINSQNEHTLPKSEVLAPYHGVSVEYFEWYDAGHTQHGCYRVVILRKFFLSP